jgi:hypothetical protein
LKSKVLALLHLDQCTQDHHVFHKQDSVAVVGLFHLVKH